MNRFAGIMQAIGWIAAVVWLATWIQGYRVEAALSELAWHTIGSMTAAALSLLARGWTLSYLLLTARDSRRAAAPGDPGSRGIAARRVAIVAALLFAAWMIFVFALSGQLLWHRIGPLTHSAVGLVTVILHVVALLLERQALASESVPSRIAPAV